MSRDKRRYTRPARLIIKGTYLAAAAVAISAMGSLATSALRPAPAPVVPVAMIAAHVAPLHHHTARHRHQLSPLAFADSGTATKMYVAHMHRVKPKPTPPPVPPTPQQYAISLFPEFGWTVSREYGCLDSLWTRESGWRYNAMNPYTGATGIPQALPGSKMATEGADYMTNPDTQIRWGLKYIEGRYGDPCGAEGHETAKGWY